MYLIYSLCNFNKNKIKRQHNSKLKTKIRLLSKYRFFNPYFLIQRSISFRIRFNEIKPVKFNLNNKNYLESLNKNAFNYGESKNEVFLNKLLLSFLFASPIIYAEETKRTNSSNEEKIFISYKFV